jgi:rare lipoprotein A
MRKLTYSALALALCALFAVPGATWADGSSAPGVVSKPPAEQAAKPAPSADQSKSEPPVDRSGRKQKGVASYYGKHFSHKKTASGMQLDPNKKTAASKTLPLGTKAEVTNKENGKKTEVVVTDRGPYVKDRVIDVTPKAAEELGMKKDGVTEVEVKPVEVPQTKEQEKAAVEEVKQQPSPPPAQPAKESQPH